MQRLVTFAAPSLIRLHQPLSTLLPQATCPARSFPTRAMASATGPKPPAAAFEPTIFDKILAKEIPSKVVYEDDEVFAFEDINPQAPVHILLIPKRRIPMLSMAQESDKEILGTLMLKADVVAQKAGLENGYRIMSTSPGHLSISAMRAVLGQLTDCSGDAQSTMGRRGSKACTTSTCTVRFMHTFFVLLAIFNADLTR